MGSAGCACKVLRRDARIDVRLPGYRLQFERTLTATSQQQDFGAATVHSAAKMKVVVVIFLWYLPLLFGFCRLVCFNRISPLGMEISAKGLPLSKILKERVEHKIGKVIDKLGQDATFHNVVLKVIKRSITGIRIKLWRFTIVVTFWSCHRVPYQLRQARGAYS